MYRYSVYASLYGMVVIVRDTFPAHRDGQRWIHKHGSYYIARYGCKLWVGLRRY